MDEGEPAFGLYLSRNVEKGYMLSMEQQDLKNVNNCLNTNIYSYLRDIWCSKF